MSKSRTRKREPSAAWLWGGDGSVGRVLSRGGRPGKPPPPPPPGIGAWHKTVIRTRDAYVRIGGAQVREMYYASSAEAKGMRSGGSAERAKGNCLDRLHAAKYASADAATYLIHTTPPQTHIRTHKPYIPYIIPLTLCAQRAECKLEFNLCTSAVCEHVLCAPIYRHIHILSPLINCAIAHEYETNWRQNGDFQIEDEEEGTKKKDGDTFRIIHHSTRQARNINSSTARTKMYAHIQTFKLFKHINHF